MNNEKDITDKSIAVNKYRRCVHSTTIDVYDVLEAFNVTCPARQHAIKKMLCAGIRGKGDVIQDLSEAGQSIKRAIEMEEQRILSNKEAK